MMHRFVPCAVAVVSLAGCSFIGTPPPPPVNPNFTPAQTYSVPPNQAWDATLAALQQQRIPVASADRATGQITTGYQSLGGRWVQGEETGEENSARVCWHLSVTANAAGSSTITAAPTIEVTTTRIGRVMETKIISYHDVTAQNPGLAQELTEGLFADVNQSLPAGSTSPPRPS